MIVFNNTISITANGNLAMSTLYSGAKIIIMKELCNDIPDLDSTMSATLLLPPYESMSCMIESDIENARLAYYNHLNSTDCATYIGVMLLAAIKGTPIVIYVDQDLVELGYVNMFCEYMMSTYGVSLASEHNLFNYYYTVESAINISSLLYMINMINHNEFFTMYPENTPLINTVLPKLSELNPYGVPRTEEGYYTYFNNLLYSIKNNNNTPLITPCSII